MKSWEVPIDCLHYSPLCSCVIDNADILFQGPDPVFKGD